MKKVKKKVLDKCIEMTRQFWSDEAGGTEFLTNRIKVAKESGVDWSCLLDLLDSILANFGFNPKATNWDIYLVLKLFGVEVVDEEVETSESLGPAHEGQGHPLGT